MKFEIVMKDEVYDEIFALMSNINQINEGKEIGGWLLGDWSEIIEKDKTKLKLLLTNFIIPQQEVSGTEVDISPESMVDTVKEIGLEESNRIKAHWHIHPFGKGDTDWSSIDESKITDFMEPEKQREIFVFLLRSEDRIKARVEINYNTKLSFMEKSLIGKESHDNLEVIRETKGIDSPYLQKLKDRIGKKVKKIKYTTVYPNGYNSGRDIDYTIPNYGNYNNNQFTILEGKKSFIVELNKDFAKFIEDSPDASEDIKYPQGISNLKKGLIEWEYKYENKESKSGIYAVLSDELEILENEYLIQRSPHLYDDYYGEY